MYKLWRKKPVRLEFQIRELLIKFAPDIYETYGYRVSLDTSSDFGDSWIVEQAFRKIHFTSAKETFDFLDRAITHDQQH